MFCGVVSGTISPLMTMILTTPTAVTMTTCKLSSKNRFQYSHAITTIFSCFIPILSCYHSYIFMFPFPYSHVIVPILFTHLHFQSFFLLLFSYSHVCIPILSCFYSNTLVLLSYSIPILSYASILSCSNFLLSCSLSCFHSHTLMFSFLFLQGSRYPFASHPEPIHQHRFHQQQATSSSHQHCSVWTYVPGQESRDPSPPTKHDHTGRWPDM